MAIEHISLLGKRYQGMIGLKGGKNSRRLKKGDIVEIEWYDTHATERLSFEEIEELDEPGATIAFGIVLKNGPQYLTIGSEISLDEDSDGNWIEQIPHASIKGVRTLGKRKLPTTVR